MLVTISRLTVKNHFDFITLFSFGIVKLAKQAVSTYLFDAPPLVEQENTENNV